MKEEKLYTSDMGYVVTVIMPVFIPPPKAIVWGERTFLRNDEGFYQECFVYFAAKIKEEE